MQLKWLSSLSVGHWLHVSRLWRLQSSVNKLKLPFISEKKTRSCINLSMSPFDGWPPSDRSLLTRILPQEWASELVFQLQTRWSDWIHFVKCSFHAVPMVHCIDCNVWNLLDYLHCLWVVFLEKYIKKHIVYAHCVCYCHRSHYPGNLGFTSRD